MISIFKSLYNQYYSIPEYNLLILGIQQTGKTRLFTLIKYIDNLNDKLGNKAYQPTVGFNTAKYRSSKAKFTIWDLGGKKALRKIWENYYSQSHCLIFMFDQRLQQGLKVLQEVLQHNQMLKIPLLMLVQKQEHKNRLQILIKEKKQNFLRQFTIQVFQFQKVGILNNGDISAKRQKLRIDQILKWIYEQTYKLDLQVRSY